MNYNINNICKLLDKIFKVGFITEKDILNIKLEDLNKISDVSAIDIQILIDLKKAIKSKRIIAFLSGEERKED